MSGRDGDSSLSLFGSLIDVAEIGSSISCNSCCKNLGDSSGKSGLTMVNVADGTNVTMGFCSFKLLFSHFKLSLLK